MTYIADGDFAFALIILGFFAYEGWKYYVDRRWPEKEDE